MKHIRLSICIPTYNFGDFIGETLESIIGQATEDVEIIIVDGASTDGTADIVKRYQLKYPRLLYHRLEKKGGIDHDLSKTIELAKGDYCWLMSSDDVLKPGAIQRVLDEIKLAHDIYLCNRTDCDRNLRPIRNRTWLSNKFKDHVFNLSKKTELIEYLKACQLIGALFSYISSIIVCRKSWNEVEYNGTFNGSNYAHVFRLLSITKNGGLLKYISNSLVLSRGDNDSFREKGLLHRFMIDFNAYSLLANNLFLGDVIVQKEFKSVMQREHVWYMLAGLRNKVEDKKKWKALEDKLLHFGYSRGKLSIIRILGSSHMAMIFLRHIRKILEKATRCFRVNSELLR